MSTERRWDFEHIGGGCPCCQMLCPVRGAARRDSNDFQILAKGNVETRGCGLPGSGHSPPPRGAKGLEVPIVNGTAVGL